MNKKSGWSTGFLKRFIKVEFWKRATLVRALNIKLMILVDDGQFGFGMIGQSCLNVF